MAKKIVEVDEDLLKGMMTSDIPLYGRDTERKETEPAPKKAATAEPENISDAPAEREISEQPKSVRNRRKKESGSDYRELFWSIRRVRTVRRPISTGIYTNESNASCRLSRRRSASPVTSAISWVTT